MSGPLSKLALHRLRPPIRRVLAVDAGSRCLKLLLAESDFGRIRVLKQESVDLIAEGLVSPEEIKSHLLATLDQWAKPPLALVLPEHLSTSHVVDLPLAPESEVAQLIADETLKLSGVSGSRIIYDFVRTETPARNRQQFWVTLCQEGDIRERLLQLGVEQEDVCEVTTTANALIAAYRATCPLSARAILVHLGAQTTVVVGLLAGQGAFATSFQMGGDFFTRALARIQQCPVEAAEGLKRQANLLSGPHALPEFAGVVDGWVAELKRQLADWFRHYPPPEADATVAEMVASGGGFDQPGLFEYLRAKAGLTLQPWPANRPNARGRARQPEAGGPAKGFEVAHGAALQALGYSPQPVSLLPDDYRLVWQKRLTRQRIELASVALAVLCSLVLAFSTWNRLSLLHRTEALLAEVNAGQQALASNAVFTADLVSEYEGLRPVLAAQQNTRDTLKTLALLEGSRGNHDLWYVLLADQFSYFRQPPALLYTNRPYKSNLLGSVLEPTPAGPSPVVNPPAAADASPAKPGLIAELCVPGDAEAAHEVLTTLVKGLKQQALFSKVDLLSDDLRRNLADPKVLVPDRHFVLALDFAEPELQKLARTKRATLAPARSGPKRVPASLPGLEPGENLTHVP